MARKIIIALGSLGVLGALLFTLAWATAAPASAAAPTGATAAAAAQVGRGSQRGQLAGAALATALIRSTADATGQTAQAVVEDLKAGQSLAQIATASGSSPEAIVKTVTDKAKARLDQAVARGRISQQRADELLQRLTTKANEVVNDTTLGTKIEDRQAQLRTKAVMPALVREASKSTGLPVGDIAGRLRDGESLTAIVESAGGDINAVIDAATAQFRATAVEAVR